MDGPAKGTVVSEASEHHVPFAVAPDPTDGNLIDSDGPVPPEVIYYPHRLTFLGHTVWVGLSEPMMPQPAGLFDLLVSDAVKQCRAT